ncbi:subtilisin-like protein [Cyathus striatus]|nr:subtilisin-like protein [Cyathus striatus]
MAFGAPSRRPHVVHEKRVVEPVDWVRSRRLEADKVLPLRIGLAQQNLHRLEELLLEVAHPESEKYGQHYTPEEIISTFAPTNEATEAVTEWLADVGLSRDRVLPSGNKGWIHVNATVAEIEDLLQTEYHVYTHSSGDEQIGCHSYSVPAHVKDHIDLIRPTVHFNHKPLQKRGLAKRDGFKGLGSPSVHEGPKQSGQQITITPSLANCDQMITPDCLRALYNFKYKPIATKKNSYGILEFTPQSFLAGDLDMFFSNFSPSLVGVRPQAVLIDGGSALIFNGESDLDLEYAMTLTDPQQITLLQTGDLVEGEILTISRAGFDNWLDAVDASFCTFESGDDPEQDGIYPDPLPGGFKGPESCGIVTPPKTVSVSYLQDESTVTPAFANRQCAEYAKLGMMGTTVFHSSGDNGVAGNGGVCLDENGKAGVKFNPGFPASCPFVTAVGATQVNPGSTVNDPKVLHGVRTDTRTRMPSYQATAVKGFLKNHPPPFSSTQFNNSGTVRAFPDLSANGANYAVAVDGKFTRVFGTSASSPVVGSLFTAINDARLALGKKSVGFINPVIYSPLFQLAFNDITVGGNQGCGTPGFNATKGWDPVTGVGTPNFEKLLTLFVLLP